MKVILLAGFLIDFLVQQPAINSVTQRTNLSYIFLGNQIRASPESLRRELKDVKPNYGYDPYWPESDWVFSRHVTTGSGKTRACTPMLCHKMHKKFGEICAINRKGIHKTFMNYCEMQDADCTEEKTVKWIIAYRGKCSELKTYPTKHASMISRAQYYIKLYNDSLTPKPTLARLTIPTPVGK